MSANTFLPPSPVIPSFLVITNMTQANPMVVTTSTTNSYVVGQLVHFSVPASYGMVEADQLTGQIVAINGLNFSVSIDSTQFSPFVIPVGTKKERPATMAPAGCRNIYNTLTEPFHSEGNFGN